MKRLAASLVFCACATLAAQTPSQYALMTSSNIQDLAGNKLVSGTITFTPVLTPGSSTAAQPQLVGGGRSIATPVVFNVTNGAISASYGTAQLVDVTQANPANFCYTSAIHDNNTGDTWYPDKCLQPAYNATGCTVATGQTTCDYDNMPPAGTPGTLVSAGPPGLVWMGTWSSSTAYQINDAVSFGGSTYVNSVAGNTGTAPPGTGWSLVAQEGAAATIAVGTVSTGAPGSSASVSNAGTSAAAIFNFSVPQGIAALLGASQGAWATETTYSVGQVVSYGGNSYASLVAANVGHEPDTSPADWGMLATLSSLPTALASQSAATPDSASFSDIVINGAGVANNGSTDNTTALNSIMANGLPVRLPNNCEGSLGTIDAAGPLSYPTDSAFVSQDFEGTGWGYSNCTSTLVATGSKYTPGFINFGYTTGYDGGQTISDMNITAPSSTSVSSGFAISYEGADGGEVANFSYLNKLKISNFPQALQFQSAGNLTLSDLTISGTPTTQANDLPVILFTAGSAGTNDNQFFALSVMCGTKAYTGLAPGGTGVSLGTPGNPITGGGNVFFLKDSFAGCTTGVYDTAGGMNEFHFGDVEGLAGPILNEQGGSSLVSVGVFPNLAYLGAPLIAKGNMSITAANPVNETPTVLTLSSQAATGGAFGANALCAATPCTVYFAYEAVGTIATGEADVAVNSGPSGALGVTFSSGTTNQATIAFPANTGSYYAIQNVTSYSVWANTTNNFGAGSGAVQIATGITTPTYTSLGTETETSLVPPPGNVPLVLQERGGTVIGNCPSTVMTPVNLLYNYGYMAMDDRGAYFNLCNGPEIPLAEFTSSSLPAASAQNQGVCNQVLPAPGAQGKPSHYCSTPITANGTTNYVWVDSWSAIGAVTFTSSVVIGSNQTTIAPSLLVMDCNAACTIELNSQPSGSWCTTVMPTAGSTLPTLRTR